MNEGGAEHPRSEAWSSPCLFSLFWSQLSTVLRNTTDMTIFKSELKTSFKPKKQKHYNYGDKLSNSLLCRLRVGRSYLKSHGFSVNLLTTDKCLCGAVDDNKHFLLFCFLFQHERSEMLSKIKCFVPNFSSLYIAKQCEILLYGINLNNQQSQGNQCQTL